MHCCQQAVWRKLGCCLVGHFAGFWKFCSRPSLTDTPACPKLLKRCTQAGDNTARTAKHEVGNETREYINFVKRQIVKKSLKFDYPPPKEVTLHRIYGFATAISKNKKAKPKNITTCIAGGFLS